MNRRKTKKVAKRFLDEGLVSVKKYNLGREEWYETANGGAWITEVRFPVRLERAIIKEAARRGWGGYYRESPLIIDIDE